MRLSPTAVIQYETCPQHYYLEQVMRIKPRYPAANLVFGRVVHQVLETWMRSWMSGSSINASAAFQTGWTQARAEGGIEYSATQSPESLQDTGKALVAQFAAAWPQFGWTPALDPQGEPLFERKLDIEREGVVYVGKPDLLALNATLEVGCLDYKTPSTPTPPEWLVASDQLMGYQILADAHAERLGLPPVQHLGLIELIKRPLPKRTGKGPEVHPPVLIPRHSQNDVEAYWRKVQWVAEDIDRGRFPKRSLMAHNSPCGLCAFKDWCHHGDPSGLILPADPPAPVAANPVVEAQPLTV